VKDFSSAVTGATSRRRSVRAPASSLRSASAALARVSRAAVSQAPGFLDDQPRGAGPQDRPEVRLPAPVIVVLSSPNVVSDAPRRVR
jgi:hypothetical protein